MLHKFLNSLQGYIFLVLKWLDNFTRFNKHIVLDESFVRVLCVPFLAHRHAHKGIELLCTAKLVGEIFHPVLLSKFLVSFLCFVDLDAAKFGILSLLFNFIDFALTDGI